MNERRVSTDHAVGTKSEHEGNRSSQELAVLLEELAANSWPPRESRRLGTWRLRANEGVTTRANSVLAAGPFPSPDWIKTVESFYREQGLPPYFHVGPSAPSGLDKQLEVAGYEVSMNCLMLAAPCQEVQRNARVNARRNVVTVPNAEGWWLDAFLRMEGFDESRRPGYVSIFSNMPSPRVFAAITEEGEQLGLATAVIERGWAGISNVIVDPRYRRKGVAIRLLHALAAWSAEAGADSMYLQVMADNKAALELYGKLGFSTVTSYHYRVRGRI
ncbi:GNAT family N-acetyltransferase [Paenibacillus puldeungensis]|uniref:GNAT family N-acetyltransferase n=1 Tax=Paenibacillus puldeungensis TaxID=696536 RepID=A0ABW3RTA8_9BACL